MTKQEKIREGMAKLEDYNCSGCTLPQTISCEHPCVAQYQQADEKLHYIHSQGGAIKVESQLPTVSWTLSGQNAPSQAECISRAFRQAYAGRVAVEPLIGD